MRQRRGHLGFVEQSLTDVGRMAELRAERLDGNRARQPHVVREVDDAHSAAPQLTLNDVAADAPPDPVVMRRRRMTDAQPRRRRTAGLAEIESMRLEQ